MATITEKEGVVQSVTDKFDGAVQVDGQWWSYTKNRKPDAVWTDPKKGDHIKMHLNPWEKDDGSVKYYVVGIEIINAFEEVATVGENGEVVLQWQDPTRRSIEKQVALKAAVDTCITLFAEDKYQTPDARIEAVLQAFSAYSGALAVD
jgi:hypothetical protein